MNKSLKILLLEDDRTDAEIIHRLLKKEVAHTDFLLVMNEKEFLSALDNFEPDLVLSDNSMPQFSALDALKIVRGRALQIPFVLITGTVSDEFAANIIKQGADDYILKDRMTRLPAAIEAALRQRQIEKEKKQTAEQLILSEEKYRTIFLKSPLPTWIYDSETLHFLDVNDAAIEHYGYTAEEFLQMTIKDIRPKKDVEEFLNDIDKVQKYLNTRQGRWRHLKKNGELTIVETTAHIIEHNRRIARLVIANDITEREIAEQKTIQSEENLKAIFDNSSEGFILLDDECVIKAFNQRASQIFLINSAKELKTGKSIFDFVQANRQVFFKHAISSVLKGEAIQYDRSYTIKKGSLMWINFMINPVWKDGIIKGACITAQDITARKEAEELQQKSLIEKNALAKRVSVILNTLPANIALLNEDGLIVDVNDSWKNFADDNGFIGTHHGVGESYINVSKKFDGEGTTVAEGIQAVLNHQQREFVFEYPCHSPTEKRWFRMVVTPLLEKEYAGAVVMHVDITELRLLEVERLHNRVEEQKKITRAILATQEKERHAIGLELHDNVNQILVGTMMALSLVKNNNEKDQQLIQTSLSQLRSAIHENRKIAHIFVAPDLKTEKLVSQLESLFDNMLSRSGMEVMLDTTQFNEYLLDSDRKANIYRIAQEQCSNILKYAKATTVDINISSSNQVFRMTIADNGKGMKADKKVTGIGLKNINDRLGLFNGKANIITAEGKGFTLEISIPL